MNEVKESHKITHQYVPSQCVYSLINVTFSCPYAHHDGIWERGGTAAHIINPVLLHTVRSASHSTCISLWENAEYQLNRRLDGPEI